MALEETEALLGSAAQDAEAAGQQNFPLTRSDVEMGEEPEGSARFVSFVLSGRRLALEVRYVCEIVSMARVTPLPGMPTYVRGIFDLRGQLLPVFDLRSLLHLPDALSPDSDWVIVCGEMQAELLIVAEGMPEISRVFAPDSASFGNEDGPEWASATASQDTIVLDGALLLSDRRFFLESEQPVGEIAGDERP
nr:Chemotaxis protein CheW [Sinorhizobium fredii NGR234]